MLGRLVIETGPEELPSPDDSCIWEVNLASFVTPNELTEAPAGFQVHFELLA